MDPKELLDVGAIAVIFAFCVKEFFTYLKNKKNGNSNGVISQAILGELTRMNNNHLEHIQDCMVQNNKDLIKAIHDDNTKMIEILGRIDGKLSK